MIRCGWLEAACDQQQIKQWRYKKKYSNDQNNDGTWGQWSQYGPTWININVVKEIGVTTLDTTAMINIMMIRGGNYIE